MSLPTNNQYTQSQRTLISLLGMLCSRLLGFARDSLLAYVLGASADIFFVAYRIPNTVRRLMADGILGMSHTSILVKYFAMEETSHSTKKLFRNKKNCLQGLRFSFHVFMYVLLWAFAISIILALCSPLIMDIFAPGFSKESIEKASRYLQLCLPYIPFAMGSAILAATLNAAGRFFFSSFASSVLNISIIASLLLFLHTTYTSGFFTDPVMWICFGLVAGAFLQLLFLLIDTYTLYRKSTENKHSFTQHKSNANRIADSTSAVTSEDKKETTLSPFSARIFEQEAFTTMSHKHGERARPHDEELPHDEKQLHLHNEEQVLHHNKEQSHDEEQHQLYNGEQPQHHDEEQLHKKEQHHFYGGKHHHNKEQPRNEEQVLHHNKEQPHDEEQHHNEEQLLHHNKEHHHVHDEEQPRPHDVIKAMPWSIIGGASQQLHMLIAYITASFLASGSISVLFFAERLIDLPLTLAGATIATVALPELTRLLQKEKTFYFQETLGKHLLSALFLLLPAAAGLAGIALPCVTLLFGHGNFDQHAVEMTSTGLGIFCVGLPAMCIVRIGTTALTAVDLSYKKQSRLSSLAFFVSAIVTAGACFFFSKIYGIYGVFLSVSLGAWTQAVCIFILLSLKGHAPKISRKETLRGIVYVLFAYAMFLLLSVLPFPYGNTTLLALCLICCVFVLTLSWFLFFRLLRYKEALYFLN